MRIKAKRARMADGNSRLTARVALVLVGLFIGATLFAPAGGLVMAQTPSPTPTGTGSPTGSPTTSPTGPAAGEAAIQLLNPSTEGIYSAADPPKLSDDFDGVDRMYHFVAVSRSAPANAIVEVYISGISLVSGLPDAEQTIDLMQRVPGTDVWETYWDIPDNRAEGLANITVRMFRQGPLGFEEVAADTVRVEVSHRDDDSPPNTDGKDAEETVEFLWPAQGGQLGFYRSKAGNWATVIDTTLSLESAFTDHFYTTTPVGSEPTWKECGHDDVRGSGTDRIPLRTTCQLAGADRPSQVTAVATQSIEADDRDAQAGNDLVANTNEAADVRVIAPYIQQPSSLRLQVMPLRTGDAFEVGRTLVGSPTDEDRPGMCLSYQLLATDPLGRPADGVNLDVHAVGPNDQLQFGDQDVIQTPVGSLEHTSSGYQPPDRGGHVVEAGHNCDRYSEGGPEGPREKPTEGEQGDHNVPGGPDVKHRETRAGAGPDAGTRPWACVPAGLFLPGQEPGSRCGAWTFDVWSRDPGLTRLTAWIDDEDGVASEDQKRPDDNDTLEADEPQIDFLAQWLNDPITVSLSPLSDVAAVGSCNAYTVRVRAGPVPIPRINVDLHATGPNNELDFCDPLDSSPRNAPALGAHDAEDEGEATHAGTPNLQHSEGNTDDAGNFIVGLTSPVSGDTIITAWVDGEPQRDNDVPNTDAEYPASRDTLACCSGVRRTGAAEVRVTGTTTWLTPGEVRVAFVNPSTYGETPDDPSGSEGDGRTVSNKQDADRTYHVVATVASLDLPGAIDILMASGANATTGFAKIGDATRVGGSDTYEFLWNVPATDTPATLRAQVPGTTVSASQTITINNADDEDDPNPAEATAETVELTRPLNGAAAPFSNRATTVSGIASAGSEGIDLYYTQVRHRAPAGADWTFCGFVDLIGRSDTSPQPFTGSCALAGTDQASQVTGIAAIPFDCTGPEEECTPDPNQAPPGARSEGHKDSGDAHRVFGFDANPLVSIEPAEAEADVGTCQRFVMSVDDQTGQAIAEAPVDVHITGPGDDPDFCDPDGSSQRSSPDGGGHTVVEGQEDEGIHDDPAAPNTQHTEGVTNSRGRFVFGVASAEAGDTQIIAWVDFAENDERGEDERADTGVMHWRVREGCTQTGTSAGEVLIGTEGDDRLCGRGGSDTLRGLGGNDTLLGNRGGDRLLGGPGDDLLRGHVGRDRLNGGQGTDICQGGRDRDVARNCETVNNARTRPRSAQLR